MKEQSTPILEFDSAKKYAISRLASELPSSFTYHSLSHTCDDVAPAAERFGVLEGVTGEALLLLRTAAYYHDIGYIEQPDDHEAASAHIAATVLPGFGYQTEQIALITDLILATKLPQSPQTLLQAILADADLDSLGRPDFLTRSYALRQELVMQGQILSEYHWLTKQQDFLQTHRYWTRAARHLRNKGKQQNSKLLRHLLLTQKLSK